jgi:hypothetical protein
VIHDESLEGPRIAPYYISYATRIQMMTNERQVSRLTAFISKIGASDTDRPMFPTPSQSILRYAINSTNAMDGVDAANSVQWRGLPRTKRRKKRLPRRLLRRLLMRLLRLRSGGAPRLIYPAYRIFQISASLGGSQTRRGT